MSILIHGGRVVDPVAGDMGNKDVWVKDDRIVAITEPAPYAADPAVDSFDPNAAIIDATNCLVVPGFVDTHRHTWQTAVRGVLPSCTLDQYFAGMLGTLVARYRPQDVYISNLMGALEALNAGITTLVDWSHISNTAAHAYAAVEGLEQAGIRAVYANGTPGSPDYWMNSEKRHPAEPLRIVQALIEDNPLLTLAMAARAPGAATLDTVEADFKLARELGIRITLHIAYRLTGDGHPHHIRQLDSRGLLGPDVTYIHCTDSSDFELDRIAATGGHVSIAPFVEMLMGHGIPPTGRCACRGINHSLSVDVVSSVPGDMWTQMHASLIAERMLQLPASSDTRFAPTYSHLDAWKAATIQGAHGCGLYDTGSLAVGKLADIVLLRTDRINTAPVVDPTFTATTAADTSNVDTVLVGGQVVKQRGRLVGHNLPTLLALLERSRKHLLEGA